jgi:hypothetical protein
MKPKHDIVKKIAWSRSDWLSGVESAIGETFMIFCAARHAEKRRKKRSARGWWSEFERKLFCRMVDVSVHPVRRSFDRKVAFEKAVAAMDGTVARLRWQVGSEYATKAVGGVRLVLDDDIELFWKKVRQTAGATVLRP